MLVYSIPETSLPIHIRYNYGPLIIVINNSPANTPYVYWSVHHKFSTLIYHKAWRSTEAESFLSAQTEAERFALKFLIKRLRHLEGVE